MCLSHKSFATSHTRQAGFGLPSAIFIIVIMALIVAAMNQLNEINAAAFGREWLSMKAFYAAESGAQLAATYALNTTQTLPTCDNNFISGLSLTASGLGSCEVNVVCSVQTVSSQAYYTFTSTGSCGNGIDQASRIVQIRLQP